MSLGWKNMFINAQLILFPGNLPTIHSQVSKPPSLPSLQARWIPHEETQPSPPLVSEATGLPAPAQSGLSSVQLKAVSMSHTATGPPPGCLSRTCLLTRDSHPREQPLLQSHSTGSEGTKHTLREAHPEVFSRLSGPVFL